MGKHEQKRQIGGLTILKLWVIRILIGSSIALFGKRIDEYLDKKYGPSDYDKKIAEVWDSVKNFF